MTSAIDNPSTKTTELSLPDGAWRIDPDRSEIGFAAKSLGGLMPVRGVFGSYSGSLRARAGAVAGELRIKAASLDTGNDKRNKHLRSPDFFDVDRHPQIVFIATKIAPGDNGLAISGELAIGASRLQLELPVTIERIADGELRLKSSSHLSRKAAGITWNWLRMVSDDVLVRAELTLKHGSHDAPVGRAA
jgi:polyisoprenoid-binding protein YceI